MEFLRVFSKAPADIINVYGTSREIETLLPVL